MPLDCHYLSPSFWLFVSSWIMSIQNFHSEYLNKHHGRTKYWLHICSCEHFLEKINIHQVNNWSSVLNKTWLKWFAWLRTETTRCCLLNTRQVYVPGVFINICIGPLPRRAQVPAPCVALQWEDRAATISTKSNEDAPMRLPPLSHPPLSIPRWDLPSSGLGGPGALLAWKCARKWGPCFSGAPTGRHRLSPLKNQRDEEEQRPAGTMRSRLPRTACLLRLFALCILLAHSAAYFGSVSLWALRPVFDSIVCFLLWQKKKWLRKLGQCRPLLRTRYLTHHARVHRRAVPKTTGRSYIFADTRCRCVIWLSSSQIAAFTHFRSTYCIFFLFFSNYDADVSQWPHILGIKHYKLIDYL